MNNDDQHNSSLEESWKPIVINNITLENYHVSNFGNVKKWDDKLMEYKNVKKRDTHFLERGNRQEVSINGKSYHIHRLVAVTFLPLDENPPIPVDDWNKTPESAKEIIKACMLVDHIDNNPYNNHASNLRWVTPRQNNSVIKKKEFEEKHGQ